MKSTSPDIIIRFGQGSPMVDVSDWVVSDIGLGDEGIFVDATPYGSTSKVNQAVGVTDQPDVTLEMLYDDDDNGPQDVFGTISGVNTPAYSLEVTWTAGSPASKSTLPCHIKAFNILGKVKDVTRARVVLTQAGPIVHVRQGA
jgi:hypothetical protein